MSFKLPSFGEKYRRKMSNMHSKKLQVRPKPIIINSNANGIMVPLINNDTKQLSFYYVPRRMYTRLKNTVPAKKPKPEHQQPWPPIVNPKYAKYMKSDHSSVQQESPAAKHQKQSEQQQSRLTLQLNRPTASIIILPPGPAASNKVYNKCQTIEDLPAPATNSSTSLSHCGETSASTSTSEQNIKREPSEELFHTCVWCGVWCETETKLNAHVKSEHLVGEQGPPKGNLKGEADTNGPTTNEKTDGDIVQSESSMVDDASSSSPNQEPKRDNPEAKPDSERAAMLAKLREMIQTRRKPRKNWPNYCAKCNVFFRRKESLRLHLRLHEKDAANLQLFKCAACEQQFDDIRTLKHHVDYINCTPRLKPEVEAPESSEFVYVGQKRKQKWINEKLPVSNGLTNERSSEQRNCKVNVNGVTVESADQLDSTISQSTTTITIPLRFTTTEKEQQQKQKFTKISSGQNKPRRMKLCNKCGKSYVVVNDQKVSVYCPQCSLKNRSSNAESESTTATTSTEHATVARTEEDRSNPCHAIHKCLLCQSSFQKAAAYDAHMTTAHSAYFKHERLRSLPTCHNVKTQKLARSEGQYWCEDCNVMFHSNNDFANHKDLNACDPTMPLPTIPLRQCDDEDANVDQTCAESDSTKLSDSSNALDSMKCIKQEPSDTNPLPTELTGVIKTEPQSTDTATTTSTSSDELIHTCHKCGISFVDFSQLEAHSTSSQCDRNDAVQQQLHVCKKCGAYFDDFWQLNSHRVQSQSQCNAPGFGTSKRMQHEGSTFSNHTTEIKVDHLYNKGVNQSSNSNVAGATISVKKAKKRRKRRRAETEVIEVEQIY